VFAPSALARLAASGATVGELEVLDDSPLDI
jgi:hypothetical protein